jgi:hypothetical protein
VPAGGTAGDGELAGGGWHETWLGFGPTGPVPGTKSEFGFTGFISL